MDPFASNGEEDTRGQPWKLWVEEELEARKKADKTEEGRQAQEERTEAYNRRNKRPSSPANKAG